MHQCRRLLRTLTTFPNVVPGNAAFPLWMASFKSGLVHAWFIMIKSQILKSADRVGYIYHYSGISHAPPMFHGWHLLKSCRCERCLHPVETRRRERWKCVLKVRWVGIKLSLLRRNAFTANEGCCALLICMLRKFPDFTQLVFVGSYCNVDTQAI